MIWIGAGLAASLDVALAVVFILAGARDSRAPQAGRIDWAGALSVTAGLAAITWSLDGNAYAIWHSDWLGETSESAPYPDPNRVYLGRATDRSGMTQINAIDRSDVGEGMVVPPILRASSANHLTKDAP